MCTAATYQTKDFYFGRTLDYEFSYGNQVVITPRNYAFPFRHEKNVPTQYAIIGMACVMDKVPLYYDAINEKGLCIAGLNFVGNAYYPSATGKAGEVAQFEWIPYLLGTCATVQEVKVLLNTITIVDTPFRADLPTAQLHWMIADASSCITVESMKDGLHIYDNPVGVLTNNPSFEQQLFNLNNYLHLSVKSPQNTFSSQLNLAPYSRGMGALGLPGDLSSQSRFVRAAFVKLNSRSGDSEAESVSQFFHILGSVDQQRGCCEVAPEQYEITIYTSCCNASKGIYYYTTYDNHQITGIDLHKENLDGTEIICFPLKKQEQIRMEN